MTVIYIDKNQRNRNKPFYDLSLWSLIFSNFLVAAWAIVSKWSLAWMMLVYWIQSLSIGFFWLLRILTVKKFIEGLESRVSSAARRSTVVGEFVLGYLGFHLVLGTVIWLHFLKDRPTVLILCAGGIFFLDGFLSFIRNKVPEYKSFQLRDFVFYPMIRIIPIHLTIFIGVAMQDFLDIDFGNSLTILLFLLLKTIVDVSTYLKERKIFF